MNGNIEKAESILLEMRAKATGNNPTMMSEIHAFDEQIKRNKAFIRAAEMRVAEWEDLQNAYDQKILELSTVADADESTMTTGDEFFSMPNSPMPSQYQPHFSTPSFVPPESDPWADPSIVETPFPTSTWTDYNPSQSTQQLAQQYQQEYDRQQAEQQQQQMIAQQQQQQLLAEQAAARQAEIERQNAEYDRQAIARIEAEQAAARREYDRQNAQQQSVWEDPLDDSFTSADIPMNHQSAPQLQHAALQAAQAGAKAAAAAQQPALQSEPVASSSTPPDDNVLNLDEPPAEAQDQTSPVYVNPNVNEYRHNAIPTAERSSITKSFNKARNNADVADGTHRVVAVTLPKHGFFTFVAKPISEIPFNQQTYLTDPAGKRVLAWVDNDASGNWRHPFVLRIENGERVLKRVETPQEGEPTYTIKPGKQGRWNDDIPFVEVTQNNPPQGGAVSKGDPKVDSGRAKWSSLVTALIQAGNDNPELKKAVSKSAKRK